LSLHSYFNYLTILNTLFILYNLSSRQKSQPKSNEIQLKCTSSNIVEIEIAKIKENNYEIQIEFDKKIEYLKQEINNLNKKIYELSLIHDNFSIIPNKIGFAYTKSPIFQSKTEPLLKCDNCNKIFIQSELEILECSECKNEGILKMVPM
jgi:hypothetical protein